MKTDEAIEIAIHCLGVQAEQEVCEECKIYGNCHTDCKDVAGVAIEALKEIRRYRDIGTVEECWEAVDKQKPKKCIEDSCPDHTHYKCPSCGRIQKTKKPKTLIFLDFLLITCQNGMLLFGDCSNQHFITMSPCCIKEMRVGPQVF